MANITALRNLINNGWTIANRKIILAHVSNADFKELTIAAKKSSVGCNLLHQIKKVRISIPYRM